MKINKERYLSRLHLANRKRPSLGLVIRVFEEYDDPSTSGGAISYQVNNGVSDMYAYIDITYIRQEIAARLSYEYLSR